MKKLLSPHKSENVGMKKFVGGIDEKNVDQHKPANDNVQSMEGIRQILLFPCFFLNRQMFV